MGETAEVAPFLRSLVSKSRRGRHRIRVSWSPYRSAHHDTSRSGFARFIPAWHHRPRPSTELDLFVLVETPEPEERDHPGPRLVVPDMTPPDSGAQPEYVGDLESTELLVTIPSNGRPTAGPTIGPGPPPSSLIDPPLTIRPAPSRRSDRSRPATKELTKSQLLPLAHPADGSSLAALFGFDETEASFGEDWKDNNGWKPAVEMVDDPWNDLPSLSTVTAELDRPGNTGDAVKMLWDATAELDMENGLLSDEVSHVQMPLRSSRRIRWSLVVSCALLAVLMGATVKVISDLPQRQAEVRQSEYAAAAGQLSGALIPVERSLGAEGLLNDSGLSTLTGQLNALDAAARASASLASERLPRAPIIGSRLPVDDLILPKQLLESASIQSISVGQRIDDARTYSLSLSTAFDLPPLPAEASLTEVDEIAEQLSLSIVETRVALTGLPDDPFFGVFRQQASDTVTMVERAQADYIAALRDGDAIAAADVSASMDASITILRDGLLVPLDQVQTWAVGQIAQVRGTVTEIESIVAT